MPYPDIVYQTLAALLQDTNTIWVTNGLGDITGVFGNAQINGLAKFIQQSPINWNGAKTITNGGDIVLTNGVTVISGTIPTSISWGDNVYNQWVVVNITSASINLLNVYYNSQGQQVSTIPPNQVLWISKGINSLWYQTNNFSTTGGSGNTTFGKVNAFVGQDSPIIIPSNAISYVINSANIAVNSVNVVINGTPMMEEFVANQIYVTIDYTTSPNFVTVNFFNWSLDSPSVNLGLPTGAQVIIKWALNANNI